MRFNRRFLLYAVLAGALAATTVARAGVFEKLDTAEEAYIYGFPMIAAYKAMYQFNIDKSSGQYKTGFNQIWNDAHVFTPKDTAIVTPNSDTPYSMLQADLRAEPIVLCVPEMQKEQGSFLAIVPRIVLELVRFVGIWSNQSRPLLRFCAPLT
jgi:hypothetical protein